MRTNGLPLRLISDRFTQTCNNLASAIRQRPESTTLTKRDRHADLLPLAERAVVTLPVPSEGLEVELLEGSVWITQFGDRQDYVLETPGTRFRSSGREKIVLQAFQFSHVAVR
jgi:hypothetical protein